MVANTLQRFFASSTLLGFLMDLMIFFVSNEAAFSSQVQQVTEYLNYRKLPRSLRNKVHDYYEHRYQRKCFNEEEILKEISPCLREVSQTLRH